MLNSTWQYMDMLVSIHVVRQVACEFLEKLDLGSQLHIHLKYVICSKYNHGIELQ